MSSSPESSSPGSEDILVEKQFEYIVVGLPPLYLYFIVTSFFIAVLVSPEAPLLPLGLWITTAVGIGISRGLHWRKQARIADRLSNAEKRAKLEQIERIGAVVHLALASVLIFVLLAPDPILRITTALAVWATTVGTALHLSILPRMATQHVCFATAVFCLMLLVSGGREGGVAALVLVAVSLALVLQLRRNFRTFKTAIEANFALDALRKDAMRLAQTDALTGLPNRRAFEERRAARIAENRPFALAAIDLDAFKLVNDTYGHQIGDELLQACANRLRALGDEVFVARIGGDEFFLMTEHINEAEALVWKAVEALSAPYAIDGRNLCVGASSGLTFWLKPGDENGLWKRADGALYQAKESGLREEADGRRSVVVDWGARQPDPSDEASKRDYGDAETGLPPEILAKPANRSEQSLARR